MPSDACSARTVVAEPDFSVIEGPFGRRVLPEMMYWDWVVGVMVLVPIVRAVGSGPRREVLEPVIRNVAPLDVWRVRTVVVEPEPRVMEEPGRRVWEEMMYSEWAFGRMVSPLMVMGASAGLVVAGVNGYRRYVVEKVEPAALVVVRIIAGRWVVEEMMLP